MLACFHVVTYSEERFNLLELSIPLPPVGLCAVGRNLRCTARVVSDAGAAAVRASQQGIRPG